MHCDAVRSMKASFLWTASCFSSPQTSSGEFVISAYKVLLSWRAVRSDLHDACRRLTAWELIAGLKKKTDIVKNFIIITAQFFRISTLIMILIQKKNLFLFDLFLSFDKWMTYRLRSAQVSRRRMLTRRLTSRCVRVSLISEPPRNKPS